MTTLPESILPRWVHRAYAFAFGYFWAPCPVCGRDFGGHESRASIPNPEKGPGAGLLICPRHPDYREERKP